MLVLIIASLKNQVFDNKNHLHSQNKRVLELVSECTGVLFILTLSTANLSHRKPAFPRHSVTFTVFRDTTKGHQYIRRVRKIAKSDC